MKKAIFIFILILLLCSCKNNLMIPTDSLGDVDLESAEALAFLSKVAGKHTGDIKDGYYFDDDGIICKRYSNGEIIAEYKMHHPVNEHRAIYTRAIGYNTVDTIFLVENNILKVGAFLTAQGLLMK